MNTGVPTDKEVGGLSSDNSWETNAHAAQKFLLFPVPDKNLPVRRTAESSDDWITLVVESCSDKFLTLVLAPLVLVIRECDLLFVAYYFADCKDSFLVFCTTLANAEEILLGRHANMGDSLSSLGAFLSRYMNVDLVTTYLAKSTRVPSLLKFCTGRRCDQLDKWLFCLPLGRERF